MLKTLFGQKKTYLYFFLCFIISQFSWGQSKTDEKLNLAQEYYKTEEFDKALELYRDLIKNKELISQIHENYLSVLLKKEELKESYNFV